MSHKTTFRFKILPFGNVMNVAEAKLKPSGSAFVTLTFSALLEKSDENIACDVCRLDFRTRF
jgi:hypothetical protein